MEKIRKLKLFAYFYPRSPCGERRNGCGRSWRKQSFLSTLSLRRATVLLVNGDGRLSYFYPRSPCGERRGRDRPLPCQRHFYPRSPCGERRPAQHWHFPEMRISIHALLAESDTVTLRFTLADTNFYPRSPCGERHTMTRDNNTLIFISIHALLAESDDLRRQARRRHPHFYPRSPCGERQPAYSWHRTASGYFYPRSPCGERPVFQRNGSDEPAISIHALLAESDRGFTAAVSCPSDFYPRSPCGERRPPAPPGQEFYKISIHALLAESDRKVPLLGIK